MCEDKQAAKKTCWFEDCARRFYSTPWGGHFRVARKEALLGFRAILDRAIEKLDELGEAPRAEKIEVE